MIISAADMPAAVRNELVRADLTSFIYRSFFELHPGIRLDMAPHVEVIATKLEKSGAGRSGG